MKKILLFSSLLALMACITPEAETHDESIIRFSGRYSRVGTFNYKGHSYICISGGVTGLLHDPDCVKCKNKK